MGLSLKNFTTSLSTKLLAGALTLGAGNAVANSVEATEITTITQNAAKLCIGSDAAGTIYGEKIGWKGTLADGQSNGISTTDNEVILDQMYNPLNTEDYQVETHRNFAYTRWPANNDITEGYYLYDITDVNNLNQTLIINSKNYPNYIDGVKIFFIKGVTPDQDQMIFPGNNFYVYKSPFDATGKVKPACKTGPIAPDFTYKINFSPDGFRVIGNCAFVLGDDGVSPNIHKLVIGQNGITDDVTILTMNGKKVYGWDPIRKGSIETKDQNGKSSTRLAVISNGSKIFLVNTENANDNEQTNAYDIAVEDPANRYMFETIDDGAGNYDIYISDSWAKPSTSKKIISGDKSYFFSGNLAYADGYPTPAWILYMDGKAHLIELTDAITMKVKVTETTFDTFTKKYPGGGKACITIPGQVATIVKTGTPADAGDASMVEQDKDAGSTPDAAAEVVITPDAGGEVDAGSTDADAAVDAWVDGKGDMQDIFADDTAPDATEKPDVPKTNDTTPDAPDSAPDQSVQEVDGFTSKDAPEVQDDVTIVIPDMGTTKNDTTTGPETEKPDAATGGPETTKPGVDAGSSSDTSPIITTTPSPKDPGCNAGSNGNASPFAIAAGVALAIGLARRKEEETVQVGQ